MTATVVLWEICGLLAPDDRVFSEALASTTAPDGSPAASFLDTDPDALGVHVGDTRLEALEREYAARRTELAETGRAPGSAEVLTRLKQADPDRVFAPLTGRTEANAAVALSATGLDRYFDLPLGTYGTDVDGRDELFPVARAVIAEKYGEQAARDLVLVTRNPVDARHATAAGVRVVGVTLDEQVRAQLLASGAADVFRDLTDVDAVTSAID